MNDLKLMDFQIHLSQIQGLMLINQNHKKFSKLKKNFKNTKVENTWTVCDGHFLEWKTWLIAQQIFEWIVPFMIQAWHLAHS